MTAKHACLLGNSRVLVRRGMAVAGSASDVGEPTTGQPVVGQPIISQKGSIWVIDFDGKTPTTGTYHPPA